MTRTPTPRPWWRPLLARARTLLTLLRRDERGDLPERTVVTALMVVLGLTVVGLLTGWVLGWVNSLPTPQ